jgi:hypothetical protein
MIADLAFNDIYTNKGPERIPLICTIMKSDENPFKLGRT